MRSAAIVLVFTIVGSVLPVPATGQPLGLLGLGVVDDHLTVGASLALPLGAATGPVLLGIGGAVEAPDEWDFSSWTYWEGNVDLIFRTTNAGRLRAIALAGFILARESRDCPFAGCTLGGPDWDTAVGMNLGAGFALVWDSFAPFLGAKMELRRGTPFAFFLGTAVPFPGYE